MATFFEWLKSTATFSKRKDLSRRLEQEIFPRVYNTQLEDRRVLNAGAVVSAIDLVTLRFDAGQAANDGGADKFELTRLDSAGSTNQVAVSINDQRVWQGSASKIQSIRFEGSSDSDQFYIDPTIQVAAGISIDGTAIANPSQPTTLSDFIVFSAPSEICFDEVTYQTSDGLAQVRFVSTVQRLDSVVQVENVESIRDFNSASQRSLIADTAGDSYTLQGFSNPDSVDLATTLQWTSNGSRLEFEAPANRLTIDMRSTTAGSDSLLIDSISGASLKQLSVLGDQADSVQLRGEISAGQAISVRAGLIDVDGVLSTTSGGEIRLDAKSGTLNVNGEILSRGDDSHRGGLVSLIGDRVLLDGSTRIDASGGAGGGQIYVGGGYQGKDASLHNSRYTYVSSKASLVADARLRGNGGTIVVWSDDTSIIEGSGNIFARGGIEHGDGGLIETSGKRFLKMDGAADTSAENGQGGTWLIDPDDIEIVTEAGFAANTSYVLISTIVTGLAGGNVTIITNTPSAGSGDIRIVDALSLAPASSRTLTLNATRDIVFQSGLTGNANLNVSLIAGRDVDSTAVTIGQLNSLSIDAARNISLGAVDLSGGTLTATIDSNNDEANALFESTGTLAAATISISGSTTVNDNVTLGSTVTTTTGAIQLSRIVDLTFRGDVAAATNVTFSNVIGPLALATNVDVTANNGPLDFSTITSGMQLTGSNGSTNTLTAQGAAGSLTLGAVATTNANVALTLSSATNTSVGSINLQNGTLTSTVDPDNNNVGATFQSTGALSAGSINLTGSATANDNLTLGSTATTTTGAIQFSQFNNLTFQGDVSAATNATFTSIAGSLALGTNVDLTANNGPLNFSAIPAGLQLTGSNGSANTITAQGATGSLTLGAVTTTNSNVALTFSSATNTSVGSINLQNGSLTSTIDSDNNNVGATFQSTGALLAGAISLSGSATANDNVTLGSTATTTTGAIQFSLINNLTFQGDVSAGTSVTFASITSPLTLESNVDITSSNGQLDFAAITAGVLLNGANGSTNVFSANGATGSITLATVSATNANVSLSLNSAADLDAEDINIQSGNLVATYSGQDVATANVATFKKVTAGSMTVSGGSRLDDRTEFNDTLTIGAGGVTVNQFGDLEINSPVNSVGGVTTTGVSGSQTHLAADVTSNGGNITMTGGTLLIDGTVVRTIWSGGGGVAAGGTIVLGSVDGENGPASLTIDSRGTATGGSVSVGTVTATTSGINRLNIRTDAPTAGQVTLSSTRLVEKGPATAATLIVATGGNAIRANGVVDLSSNSAIDGGSIDFGTSEVTPTTAASTLTLRTSNTNAAGGNGGNIQIGGVSNNGVNYLDSVLIDTSAANVAKVHGDLDFNAKANPRIAVDGTSGTGITLIGTIVKAFGGVLSFLTNPSGASANSSSIDVSKANFQSTNGLAFDTFGGAAANAGDVILGDIGVLAANRPNTLTIDTRGTTSSGDLLLDDGSGASTELHVDGDLNLINSKIKLTDNALLRTYGTGNMVLGDVATVAAAARDLTLISEANITASAIDLTGGALTATVDSNDNNVGSSFSSTGAVSAGTVSIAGSASNNDVITISSTLSSSSGVIAFSQLEKVTINGDVASQTSITFTNVSGLTLGTNADVTANNGPIDFTTISTGILLAGANGSTNVLTSRGAAGSLNIGSVTATNSNVALNLSSATNTTVGTINLQNGSLITTIDADNNNVGSTFLATGALSAGSVAVSGSTTVNDLVTFGSTVTTTTGSIQVTQFDDLRISGDWTTVGGVTTTGISTSKIHLTANITSNGGSISMTGGTLLVDGTTVRQIKSGGAGVSSINGGAITLGEIDGEADVAELEIDSRGSSTSGNVSLGNVTNAAGNTGLTRLRIETDSAAPGQVSLSNIRLIAKNATPSSLSVNAGGRTILADGTIDLSSSVNGLAGGRVDFGNSLVAPKTANSTLSLNTSNTNATSGADGSNGGDVLLGGIGVNSLGGTYFDAVTIDLSAADILDSAGTLRFGTVANPSIQVDGVAGTGIRVVGRVDNAAGNIVSMATNPAVATQNTAAIDVSRTTFIGSGGLNFNTSGGNLALNSGSISVGDIGTIVRPLSLVVDTRGTVSSGHLILNDDVAGSATEIRIDGTIDFSNAAVDLLDDVTLSAHQDGSNILLGATSALGGARNLQLASDSGATVSSIDLSGGAFQADIDVNNNEAGIIFRSNGTIAAGSFSVSGSAANNDIASIGAGITTTGSVNFSNFDQLSIQGLITAGTTFNASNIVGAVDFSGNSGIVANGSIDLLTSVNSIRLSGIAGDTTLIEAKGNTSVATLAAVTATNPGTRLNVRSDYSADLRNVDMLTGTLDVQIGRSTTRTDAVADLRQVTAGGLVVSGTSTANDTAVLGGLLNIGTAGISIQNLAKLDVNFNVQSAGDIAANNILDRIQIAEAISIQSDGGIDLQTNVSQIQLIGINGLTNLFRAGGDTSSLNLAAVQALQNVVLLITSANDVSLVSIAANLAELSIEVDNNDNTLGSQLTAGQIQAKQISVLGGSELNDIANFAGLLESKAGSLLVSSFGTVNLSGDVLSSNGLDVSSVSGRVNIGTGRLVKANNGNVTLNNSVNEVRFAGGVGTSTSIQSVNGNVLMSAMTEVNSSDFIELRADRDISLSSSNLNSRLQVVAGDHNSATGSINASATLVAGPISMEAASGIGTSGAIATSSNSISATNRLAGVVQISNNKAGTVTVPNLVANQGGNILFTQSGGEVRFQQVTSNPDGTPAANESGIRLVSVGGGLVVEGSGVSAGGLGSVLLQTQNLADIQVLATVRSNAGTVSVESAQRINGGGILGAQQVDLSAASGIGTTGPVQTQTSQLRVNSQSNSVDVQNTSASLSTVSQLRSGGDGTVQFNQVGGGDVAFLNVETGTAASNAGSNINLRNSNGSVLVQGNVVAGGGGSIRFDAQNNLAIGAGSLVQTNGVNATISGNAGGQFQFTPGAAIRAGSSNANTEAVVTALPPLVSVRPTVNSLGVNVDSEGFATLQIQLGSASPALIDRNFSVVIDWGDNEIDRFPIGTLSPLTTDPQISRFDGSGVIYQITHQYRGNPDPNDPIADIPVKVTVGIDALNRIQFNDSQGPVANLSKEVNESLVTPAAGLISLRFDLPQAPTIPSRIVFNNLGVEPSSSSIAPVAQSTEITISSSGSAAEKSRSNVLRIITPINEQGEFASSEDIKLEAEDIEGLSNGKLFEKLGDNRYRIFLIREDGVELLLKDFYLRNHRPFEVEDSPASSSTPQVDERVLSEQPPAVSQENRGRPSSRAESSEENEVDHRGEEAMIGNRKGEEKSMTSATLATGTIALTMRSWRKAARRFRAG